MSRELVNLIYLDFKENRDIIFKNHITVAGISSMNNISEGFCRSSDAELRQLLNIAKGSTGEIKNMYYIAEDQDYILANVAIERRKKYQMLMNGISSFIKYLKSGK